MNTIYAKNWKDIDPDDWSQWPCKWFKPFEVRDRRTGEVKTTVEFLAWMDKLRDAVGEPLKVNSWYRAPASNAAVSSTGQTGAHTTGLAVDLAVSHALAHRVVILALEMGCKRIGMRQHGDASRRFVHIDLAPGKPSPRFWTYEE